MILNLKLMHSKVIACILISQDDQQKFLTDTTLQSAEQVSQLSADLNRCEATNRVMRTQVEALKRQIVNLGLREKQARELVKNLKNQLIRRWFNFDSFTLSLLLTFIHLQARDFHEIRTNLQLQRRSAPT
jgi:bifunctional ADP-heptose synthase (sugar kinase/adenylyltransferase)